MSQRSRKMDLNFNSGINNDRLMEKNIQRLESNFRNMGDWVIPKIADDL